jgi:hypothetical protein
VRCSHATTTARRASASAGQTLAASSAPRHSAGVDARKKAYPSCASLANRAVARAAKRARGERASPRVRPARQFSAREVDQRVRARGERGGARGRDGGTRRRGVGSSARALRGDQERRGGEPVRAGDDGEETRLLSYATRRVDIVFEER